MKDYMLIFIGTNYESMGLTPDEYKQRMGNWFQWQEKMKADGIEIKSGNALHSHGKVVTGPDRIQTDKTATELKELVGGYYVVGARDYEHAMQIAEGYPDYDLGGRVEIREVIVFDN